MERIPTPLLIGWAEWVSLPDLGIARIKAKVDTGARSCALHVTSIRPHLQPDGRSLLELEIPLRTGTRSQKAILARAMLVGTLTVRDSGAHAEKRLVIETTLQLGPIVRRVGLTLTSRGDMRFPMLIGRTGIAQDFLVDASARYLLGKKKTGG